jgi:hypothetical protein
VEVPARRAALVAGRAGGQQPRAGGRPPYGSHNAGSEHAFLAALMHHRVSIAVRALLKPPSLSFDGANAARLLLLARTEPPLFEALARRALGEPFATSVLAASKAGDEGAKLLVAELDSDGRDGGIGGDRADFAHLAAVRAAAKAAAEKAAAERERLAQERAQATTFLRRALARAQVVAELLSEGWTREALLAAMHCVACEEPLSLDDLRLRTMHSCGGDRFPLCAENLRVPPRALRAELVRVAISLRLAEIRGRERWVRRRVMWSLRGLQRRREASPRALPLRTPRALRFQGHVRLCQAREARDSSRGGGGRREFGCVSALLSFCRVCLSRACALPARALLDDARAGVAREHGAGSASACACCSELTGPPRPAQRAERL